MIEYVGMSKPQKHANKETNQFHITLHNYLHHYKAKYKEVYLCGVIWKWFV